MFLSYAPIVLVPINTWLSTTPSLLISPTHDGMLGNREIKAAFFIYLREVASAYLLYNI